jgi:uncharacterized protein
MIIDETTEATPGIPVTIEDPTNDRKYKALVITGICLSVMLLPYLAQLFLIWGFSYTGRIIGSELLEWVATGIMFLYAWYAEGTKFFLWEEKKYSPGFYIGSTIVVFLMFLGAAFISRIPYYLGFHENNDAAKKMVSILTTYPMLLVGSCLTAGIIEEFIFRGYILSRLSLFFKNKHWPVIISALIFTSIHLAYKTVHELIFVFLIGLIFGYYYQRYRNLMVLIIVHFAIDYLAFTSYQHFHK